MTTVRLDIEYDGGGFKGWAKQPGLRTVQGELEAALATVLREPVELTVAGRTDTGVHALGQVASFVTAAEVPGDLARRLNGVGPDDIAVTARRSPRTASTPAATPCRAATATACSPARRSSPFEQGRALWWPHRVDREALDACAAALAGTHDFTAFTPTQTDHVRFERDDPRRRLDAGRRHPHLPSHRRRLHAQHGPRPGRHDAGRLIRPPQTLDELHEAPRGRARSSAGDTAPPHGLYLESVGYES